MNSLKPQSKAHPLSVFIISAFLLSCCGTIAGNPKKPSTPPGNIDLPPQDPQPDPAVTATLEKMKLPLISLELGDTTADDTGIGLLLTGDPSDLNLVDDEDLREAIDQTDTFLNRWSKRVERIVDNMNSVSRAVNTYLETNQAELESQSTKARIRKKTTERRASAIIEKQKDSNGTSYQATICFGDKVGAQLTWDESQTKISFTRDLKAKVKDLDEDIALVSQLTVEKQANGTLYKLATSGSWNSFPTTGTDGANTVDYTESFISASGVIELKYVADSFEAPPPDQKFEGDSYLVGRIHPTALKGSNGKLRTKKEFVAYQKNLAATVCKNGFDENLPTLWNPKLSEPRFCLGRPLGSGKFKNMNSYLDTLSSLKPIGLAGKISLKIPVFSKNTLCDF